MFVDNFRSKGSIFDISLQRAPGNLRIDHESYVIHPDCKMFEKFIGFIMDQNQNQKLQILNIFGLNGVGKTQFLMQAAIFMK